MGLLVILPFAALAGWLIFQIHHWLFHGEFGPEWRRRFVMLAIVGIVLGAWLVFFCGYNVARMHMESFPIPTAIWSREHADKLEEPLVRHVLPPVIRGAAVITDFLCATVACLAPLALVAFITENRGQKDFGGTRG